MDTIDFALITYLGFPLYDDMKIFTFPLLESFFIIFTFCLGEQF